MLTPLTNEELLETYKAYEANGRNAAATARELGLSREAVRDRVYRARERGLALPVGVQEALATVGIDNARLVRGGWLKTKTASVQFRLEPDAVDYHSTAERLREALRDLPAARLSALPDDTDKASMTLYPLPDIHAGMKYGRWGIAECVERVNLAFETLIGTAPISTTAVILILGDMLHHNDRSNQTQSGHVLDVDCTPEEAASKMIAAISHGIELALLKHDEVIVSVLRGNHDRDAYLIVLYSLVERFRNEPRVSVNKDDSEFFIFPWEDVLIFAHHGDKGKPERMVMAFANEYRELWGAAKHSYLFTGHLHHLKSADIGGVQWEQLRAVTPRDDYAVSNSFSGRSSAVAITYQKGKGEVSRITVNL